jgi:phospho-N-acetylmuramoyl-pentapeptide-transferase
VLLYLFFNVLSKYDALSWLRVFRYPSMRILAAAITALLLSFAIGPWFIDRLRARQIGQQIREDGPKSHKKKAGTPTMGGALILFCLVVSTLLWCDLSNRLVLLALMVTVLFGAIGFADDYAKGHQAQHQGHVGQAAPAARVRGRRRRPVLPVPVRHHAARAAQRAAAAVHQLLRGVADAVVVAVHRVRLVRRGRHRQRGQPHRRPRRPRHRPVDHQRRHLPAVRVHRRGRDHHPDQDDGGEESIAQYLHVAHIPGAVELAVFCAALFGAGVGFLWFNTYPASVFMGDVGSLSIGGAIGMLAVLTKNELTLVLVGGLFLIEALSVIIQVGSFKTRGKRVFRMAPIHHHYELKGWEEPKIIVRFWLISILLGLLAVGTLKLR